MEGGLDQGDVGRLCLCADPKTTCIQTEDILQ